MSDPDEDPTVPDRLPDSLIEQIDNLEVSELRAILSYVEQRIESLRTSIEEEIVADAAGEVIEIEDHGDYALVRKHPPNPDGLGVNTDIVSIYHVRQEPQLGGEETLHWSYLGDVRTPEQSRCANCGRTLDEDVDVCPHCGSNEIDHSKMED